MATREEIIGRMHVGHDAKPENYEAARGIEEQHHDREMKRSFLNHFYETPEGERWNLEGYDRQIWSWVEEQAWPWDTQTILTAIADLRKIGRIGKPLSPEEVAQRKADAKAEADAAEQREREKLIQRILDARHPNDSRVTHFSDVAWECTQDVYRKELSTFSTEQLRQRVAELKGAARLRGMSHDELKRAAREGQTAATVSAPTQSAPKRRSPNYALPTDYSAERLRRMSQQEMKSLCRFPDGRPRRVGGTNDNGAPVVMMDAVLDRLNSLS